MKRNLLLLWAIVLGTTSVFGQAASFRNFSVDDGVAQSQVYALLQDHQGNIWMGTRGGGISKFDGKEFEHISQRNGLVNNYIHKIKQGSDLRIWIATNNGVSAYDGEKFTNYSLPTGKGNLTVYDLAIQKNGTIWLGTNLGVYAIENDQLVEKNKPFGMEPNNVNAIFIDSKNRMWLGTGKGMHRAIQNKGNWKRSFMGDTYRQMKNAITCIEEDKRGNIWFGTYGDGMFCHNNRITYRIDLQRELYKSSVFDILFDDDGSCWIATLRKGIVQYDPLTKNFTFYGQYQGLSNNHVRSILQDNTKTLWFGTSGGGVCQFSGSEFSHFTKESGLGGNFVYSIYRDKSDRLWVGTGMNGVSLLENNQFKQFNSSNGFASIKVKALAEDRNGNMYLGTEGKGVFRYKNGRFSVIAGTEKQYIRQMALHPDGTIWAATSGAGLLQISPSENRVKTRFNYANARLLQSRLTSLFIDEFGRIWYGAESYGLGIIDPKTKQTWRFKKKDGLPANAIRSIAADEKGNVWVGTAGGGLACFQSGKNPKVIRQLGLEDGLSSANVYLIVSGNDNSLIVGTESGLDEVIFNKNDSISKIKHYAKSDGFRGVETCQNAVFKDSDGKMWFGTINGLTCYNPEKASENTIPPMISIADVHLFYESISKTKYKSFLGAWNEISPISLPYDQNHLSFIFKGINHRNPDGVEYSWRLEGSEEEWSPWSKEQRIVYSNMNSGDYNFLLRARNEDGYITAKHLNLPIQIETPFWRKTWFYILISLLVILFISGLFRWQSNRIRKKAQAAQEQAELAKNLVELEQKALRLQMNPHFIFNALNSIQGLIGTPNEKEARYYLAKFSRLMRQILDNSRATTITLEEEKATLENYLLIEQFCNGNRFDYNIEMELETEPNYVQLPPMLIQPFVENSIKHGFKFHGENAEKRGNLTIRFTETENAVLCEVTDNGIGREEAKRMALDRMESGHVSAGLNVTQERLDLLSEDADKYAVEIIDLMDENNLGSGTKVKISIPLL